MNGPLNQSINQSQKRFSIAPPTVVDSNTEQ